MARISQLFALALVLAIGSVTAHPPSQKKTQKNVCPSTLAGLQKFPSVEISKLVEKKADSGPDTVQFRALFAACKSFNDYLATIKFSAAKNAYGLVYAKYAAVTRAMLAAQALVGVDGELSVKLRKSYSVMAERYVNVVKVVAEISAKYQFSANAKISMSDRANVEKCLIKLEASIAVFVKVVSECSKEFSLSRPGLPIGFGGGFIGARANKALGVSDELIRLGAQGQVGAEIEAGVKLGGHAGGKIGAKAGAKAGAKVGAHVGAKVGANAGAKVGAKGEVKVGGHAGAKTGGLFGGFLGFGGKVQYDAAGKAKIGGGSGFKSLSHPREKHLD